MTIDYERLKSEMPHKWKVQIANERSCTCVAYVDSRQVQDRLDEVVGPENWSDEYQQIDGQLFCRIGINTSNGWVYKTDCGTESMTEKEKGQVSDAFKRAAVKWGVGRFLYSKDIQRVKSCDIGRGKYGPADENGKRIWDLTTYINNRLGENSNNNAKATSTSPSKSSGSSKPGRYNADKGGANVSYQKGHNYSEETINTVQGLERDGKKGKDVLSAYLSSYNKEKEKSFKLISEMEEADLKDLIEFIQNQPPTDL